MQKVMQEFKAFLMKGSLVQLAIAFVMGIAFSTLVTSFINTMINPLIGAIFTEPSFSSVTIPLWSDARLQIGSFVMALITFVAVAASEAMATGSAVVSSSTALAATIRSGFWFFRL